MDDQTGVKLEDLQMIVGGTTRDKSLYAIPKFRSVLKNSLESVLKY